MEGFSDGLQEKPNSGIMEEARLEKLDLIQRIATCIFLFLHVLVSCLGLAETGWIMYFVCQNVHLSFKLLGVFGV